MIGNLTCEPKENLIALVEWYCRSLVSMLCDLHANHELGIHKGT